MAYALGVEERKRAGQLRQQRARLGLGQSTLRADLIEEIATGDELHDKVKVLLVLVAALNLRDVRVQR